MCDVQISIPHQADPRQGRVAKHESFNDEILIKFNGQITGN